MPDGNNVQLTRISEQIGLMIDLLKECCVQTEDKSLKDHREQNEVMVEEVITQATSEKADTGDSSKPTDVRVINIEDFNGSVTKTVPDTSFMPTPPGKTPWEKWQEGQKKDDKPRQVVKDSSPVKITDIVPKTLNKLALAIGGDKDGKGDSRESKTGGFVESLISTIGKPILALAGGILALLSAANINFDAFEGLVNVIGKQGLMAGLKMFLKPFARLAGGLIRKIPVIGAIVSFYFAKERFDSGDNIGAFIDLASGTANLLNLFLPGIGSMLSIGLDILNAYLDVKTSDADDPQAAKLDLLKEMAAGVWGVIEPVIRYVPIVGSFWLLKDAWDSFSGGKIADGLIYLARGIVNLKPGLGTLLNVGLGVVQGFMDPSKAEADPIAGAAVDFLSSFSEPFMAYVDPWIRDVPFIGGLFFAADMIDNFKQGKIAEGITDLGMAILSFIPGWQYLNPAFSFLRGMADPDYASKSAIGSLGSDTLDFMGKMVDVVQDWVAGMLWGMADSLPGPIKYAFQKGLDWLGIEKPSEAKREPEPKMHTTTKGIERKQLTEEQFKHLTDETIEEFISNEDADISQEEFMMAIRERRNRAEKREMGGPVVENKPYIVGESGPETFIAEQSGEIQTASETDVFTQSLSDMVKLLNHNNEILAKLSGDILTAIEETGTTVNNTSLAASSVSTNTGLSDVRSFRDNVRNQWFS